MFSKTEIFRRTDLVTLKSDVEKLAIDKLKNVLSNLSNLKSKVDKLDVDELVLVDVSKLNVVVKKMLLKKMYLMLRSNILKIKLEISLT